MGARMSNSARSSRAKSRVRLLDFARSERTSGARGFTLIEIMVALAVFALAALALVRLEGATLRGVGFVDSATLAQVVARNVAVEAMTDARSPAAGRVAGVEENGGRRWRWTREVRAIGDGQVLRIDVAVADTDGRVLGKLTMVRPPPRPAPTPSPSPSPPIS